MAQRILFLVPDLNFRGTATQLQLLAPRLQDAGIEAGIVALGGDGPTGAALRALGVRVEVLAWKRALDATALLRLAQLARELEPSVVHVWGRKSLRAAFLVGLGRRCRIVAQIRMVQHKRSIAAEWVDRQLLQRVDRVIVNHTSHAHQVERIGLPARKLGVIAPGVASSLPEQNSAGNIRRALDLPEAARLLTCLGPIESRKGFQHAIWAYDILRYLYEDLHLVLAGTGPEIVRLRQFCRAIEMAERIHFVGPVAEVRPLLATSAVVWVPTVTDGGANVALEALAAGRPVVATDVPCLSDVIEDGVTGLIMPPGRAVALARQTRRLLDDPAWAESLGRAGRQHVAAHFGPGRLVLEHVQLYQSLCA